MEGGKLNGRGRKKEGIERIRGRWSEKKGEITTGQERGRGRKGEGWRANPKIGRLTQNDKNLSHLAAQCATTSSSCTTFEFWLLVGRPLYGPLDGRI